MKLLKKSLAVLLALVICASTVAPAFAYDYNAADGTVHVDGNLSWQDNHSDYNSADNGYDHEANNDYAVNISGQTDKTVVEVTEDASQNIQVNIDKVTADVKDGPAANIQGGNVDIKDSTLSGGDEDGTAVKIGGEADVTINGDTTINGSGTGIEMTDNSSLTVEDGANLTVNGDKTEVTESGEVEGGNTGIDMKGNSSLTVEEGGELEANGSYVTAGTAGVSVNGGNTGIKAEDSSQITVKGDVETNGSKVTSSGKKPTVDQDENVGLDVSDKSHVSVDGGNLTAVDTQVSGGGTFNGEGTGAELGDSATIKVDNDGTLSAAGDKNAVELTGDSKVEIGKDGLLNILAGPVSIGENSALESSGMIMGTAIENFKKGDVVGHDAIDFKGTGLHFVNCVKNGYWGPGTFYLYWDVDDDYVEDTLTISPTELLNAALKLCKKGYLEAGDQYNFNIVITNNGSRTLTYKEGSLSVDRGKPTEKIERYADNWSLRHDNVALRALFSGATEEQIKNSTSLANLKRGGTAASQWDSQYLKEITFDAMLNLENYLKETGFNGTKFNSVEEYYLYFINTADNKEYKSLTEVPADRFAYLFSTPYREKTATKTVNEAELQTLQETAASQGVTLKVTNQNNGKYIVSVQESETIRDASLRYAYGALMGFGYGGPFTGSTSELKDGKFFQSHDGTYVDDFVTGSKVLAEAEAYLKGLFGDDGALNKKGEEGDSITLQGYYFLHGAAGNDIQNSTLAWESVAALDVPPAPSDDPDDPTPPPSDDPDDPTPPPSEDPDDPTPPPSEDPDDPTPPPSEDPDDPTPTPTPTPPVEVDEPEVPLTPEPPVEVDEPDVPLTPEPPVEIDEPDVPLADEPEPEIEIDEPDVPLADEPEPEIEIDDPDVPLADVPQTGDNSYIWTILTVASGAGLAWLALHDKKRKRTGSNQIT